MTEGLTRQGFDIDVARFEQEEQSFANVILNPNTKIEHKDDEKARHTGNIFLEYSQPSGESGIAATTADYWAIEYFDNVWLFISTEKLRALGHKAYSEGRTASGGDYNNYKGVLIPIKWLYNFDILQQL